MIPTTAEEPEEVEIAEAAEDFETVLSQLLAGAIYHGMIVEAVEGLMALAAEGTEGTAAIMRVADELGIPRPRRLH